LNWNFCPSRTRISSNKRYVRDDNGSIIVNQFGLPTASSNSILGKATLDYILGLSNSLNIKA
jgi:hypothetical protein